MSNTAKPNFLSEHGLFKYKQDRRKYIIKKMDGALIGADAATLGAVFAMSFTTSLTQSFENVGKYYILPIALFANFIRTVLAWLEVRENKRKNGTVENAVVETIALAGLAVSVVIKLALDIALAYLVPIIFGGIMALKTFYNLVAGGYYYGKSVLENDPKLSESYRVRGTIQVAAGGASIVAGITVVGVMMLMHKFLSIFGVLASAAGVGVGIYKWKKGIAPKAHEYETLPEYQDFDNDEKPKRTPKRIRRANLISMHRTLGVKTNGDYQLIPEEVDENVDRVKPSFKNNDNRYYKRFDPDKQNKKEILNMEEGRESKRCNM